VSKLLDKYNQQLPFQIIFFILAFNQWSLQGCNWLYEYGGLCSAALSQS